MQGIALFIAAFSSTLWLLFRAAHRKQQENEQANELDELRQ